MERRKRFKLKATFYIKLGMGMGVGVERKLSHGMGSGAIIFKSLKSVLNSNP